MNEKEIPSEEELNRMIAEARLKEGGTSIIGCRDRTEEEFDRICKLFGVEDYSNP